MLRQMRDETGAAIPCVVQLSYSDMTEVPAETRAPYTGSLEQLMDDLRVFADGGVDHAYVTLSDAVHDVNALIDVAGKLHAYATNAGIV
jgi:hypothetical protein